MDVLRTPDERFASLPGFPFAPRYVEVDGLRMHYVDEGPRDGQVVLLLHGEPTWSYLYRKMVPPLVAAGHRVVAPDFIGFGRSDKPVERAAYSYASHLTWATGFLDAVGLTDITLFCQDWGGLIGLRLVAAQPERFRRVAASNTFLPTGEPPPPRAFFRWQAFSQEMNPFASGWIVAGGCARPVDEAVMAAYDAPFPDERYLAGARQFPLLVPSSPEDPAAGPNRQAWEVLRRFERPFLTLFGDSDPITGGAAPLLQAQIPGAAGQPHATLERTGHFSQEDAGEELARHLVAFMAP